MQQLSFAPLPAAFNFRLQPSAFSLFLSGLLISFASALSTA
jgi:hypothetical protein